MKVGYTEFSYGFAFTENLIRSSVGAPVGAPHFPNLIEEGGLGYDVRIELPASPLFFQFKLPDLMVGSKSAEFKNPNCANLTLPYYRIGLMRRDISDQHKLLLGRERDFPGRVYYVAGLLDSVEAFSRAYNAGEVADRSAWFAPSQIGPLPDDKAHSIVYSPDRFTSYFCSEPLKLVASNLRQVGDLLRLEWQETPQTLQTVVGKVIDSLLYAATPSMRDAAFGIRERIRQRVQLTAPVPALSPEVLDTAIEMLAAREIARVELGLELLFAQPKQEDPDMEILANLRL